MAIPTGHGRTGTNQARAELVEVFEKSHLPVFELVVGCIA